MAFLLQGRVHLSWPQREALGTSYSQGPGGLPLLSEAVYIEAYTLAGRAAPKPSAHL